jgi:hypothetical protein
MINKKERTCVIIFGENDKKCCKLDINSNLNNIRENI